MPRHVNFGACWCGDSHVGEHSKPPEDLSTGSGEWVTRNGVLVWVANRCGTKGGYYDHYNAGEPACRPCLDALAAYARQWARSRGVKPRKLHPCGTPGAYRRHLRHGEPPCDACLAAIRQRYHDNKGRWPKKKESA